MSTKTFSDAALLSLMSGVLVGDFGEMQEAVQVLAGGPVWTHQLPRVCREMRPALARLWPDLAAIDVSGVSAETFPAWKAAHPELYGPTARREVTQLPGVWLGDPIAEAKEMAPNATILGVIGPGARR